MLLSQNSRNFVARHYLLFPFFIGIQPYKQPYFCASYIFALSRKFRNKQLPIEGIAITAYAAEGKSIAHLPDGRVAFVEGAVPGDVVTLRLVKSKKSFAEAKAMAVTTPSQDRVEPF